MSEKKWINQQRLIALAVLILKQQSTVIAGTLQNNRRRRIFEMVVVGLLPFDSKIPSLPSMKISTYHQSKSDSTALFDKLESKPDKVYVTLVFTWNKEKMEKTIRNYQAFFPDVEFVYGGSGYSLENLPDKIELLKPDYDLYPSTYSMGFTSRGCLRKCKFCIVPEKEGVIREHQSLKDIVDDRFNELMLLDNNFLASPKSKEKLLELKDRGLKIDFNQGLDIRLLNRENVKLLADLKCYGYPKWRKPTFRFAFDDSREKEKVERGIKLLQEAGVSPKSLFFYILVGFNTTIEQDVARVEFIASFGARPFIMKYRDPKSTTSKSTPDLMKLAKWVNKLPWYEKFGFEEFDPSLIKGSCKTKEEVNHQLG